jgi:hypothetical protein
LANINAIPDNAPEFTPDVCVLVLIDLKQYPAPALIPVVVVV